MKTVKLGRNGQPSLPKAVMKRLHLRGNEILLLGVTGDGVIQLRPAAALPIEMYTPERIAEFERESGIDEVTRDAVREA
jgi:AbrB family looped-hinge helix DNA binding protein